MSFILRGLRPTGDTSSGGLLLLGFVSAPSGGSYITFGLNQSIDRFLLRGLAPNPGIGQIFSILITDGIFIPDAPAAGNRLQEDAVVDKLFVMDPAFVRETDDVVTDFMFLREMQQREFNLTNVIDRPLLFDSVLRTLDIGRVSLDGFFFGDSAQVDMNVFRTSDLAAIDYLMLLDSSSVLLTGPNAGVVNQTDSLLLSETLFIQTEMVDIDQLAFGDAGAFDLSHTEAVDNCLFFDRGYVDLSIYGGTDRILLHDVLTLREIAVQPTDSLYLMDFFEVDVGPIDVRRVSLLDGLVFDDSTSHPEYSPAARTDNLLFNEFVLVEKSVAIGPPLITYIQFTVEDLLDPELRGVVIPEDQEPVI